MEHFLDTDFYLLTMGQAIMQQYPDTYVRDEFINRSNTPIPKEVGEHLKVEIQRFSELSLSGEDAKWLQKAAPFLSPAYIDFLKGYRFNPEEVKIEYTDDLKITIEGYMYRTVLW